MTAQTAQQQVTVEMIKNAVIKSVVDGEYIDIDLQLKNGDTILLSESDGMVIQDNRVHIECNHEFLGYVFEGTKKNCYEVCDYLNTVIYNCRVKAGLFK